MDRTGASRKRFARQFHHNLCDRAWRVLSCVVDYSGLPMSREDIKDGLLKMILFTNLKHLKVGDKGYKPVPILKLTTGADFNLSSLSPSQRTLLADLEQEAGTNVFFR